MTKCASLTNLCQIFFTVVMNKTEALGLKTPHFWETSSLLRITYNSLFKMSPLHK